MIELRDARREEADQLSALVLRSKAHWGYDADFLTAVREELRVRPDVLGHDLAVVAEKDGVLAGLGVVLGAAPVAELDLLFVDPPFIGTGVGRLLLAELRRRAGEHGIGTLELDADPGAEAFYLGQGAEVIGRTPSGSVPGRFLPRLRLPV